MKNKQKDKFQKHRKYLDYWVEEAERREKRQASKELPFGNEQKMYNSAARADKRTDHTAQNSSLYPLRELQCAKVDFDLDSWPRPYRQMPQQPQIQLHCKKFTVKFTVTYWQFWLPVRL